MKRFILLGIVTLIAFGCAESLRVEYPTPEGPIIYVVRGERLVKSLHFTRNTDGSIVVSVDSASTKEFEGKQTQGLIEALNLLIQRVPIVAP